MTGGVAGALFFSITTLLYYTWIKAYRENHFDSVPVSLAIYSIFTIAAKCGEVLKRVCRCGGVSHWNHPSIGVLLQQADGLFTPMLLYAAPQAGYDDIDVGDTNGDGHLDVVKMNGQFSVNPNLSVYHQTITGSLTSAIAYDLEGAFLSQGMAVGDVTADGRADVVITHRGDATDPINPKLSVFAQQADGSLLLTATYAAPPYPDAVEIADIDGDGRQDVLTVTETNLLFYRQTADGKLAAYEAYPVAYATDYKPQGLDVGDLNQDDQPDVVIANYNSGLVVLYQGDAPTPTATPTLAPTAPPGSTPTPVATPTVPPPSGNLRVLYLPLIVAPQRVEPAIFAATTQCQNEAVDWQFSPVTYEHGKRILATSASFSNQIGREWRVQWTFNDQYRPDLDHTGTLTESPEEVIVQIFYGTNGQCESLLPRGVYEVEIFLGNELLQRGKATIQ